MRAGIAAGDYRGAGVEIATVNPRIARVVIAGKGGIQRGSRNFSDEFRYHIRAIGTGIAAEYRVLLDVGAAQCDFDHDVIANAAAIAQLTGTQVSRLPIVIASTPIAGHRETLSVCSQQATHRAAVRTMNDLIRILNG